MDENSPMMVRSNLLGKDPTSGVNATVISESCHATIRSSSSSQDVHLLQASSEDSGAVNSGVRNTVSILAIAPTKKQPPTEATGATVFVGAGGTSSVASANGAANAPANWTQTSIPEVHTVNGYGTRHQDWQKETGQQLHATPVLGQGQQKHQQQSSQTHQTGQHVVKIRINPELETSRVVSSIRLNPSRIDEGSVKPVKSDVNKSHGDNKGTIVDGDNPREEESWTKADNGARLSGRIVANEPAGQSDSCVRINVVSGNIANKYRIDNQRENNRKNTLDNCVETAKNSDNRAPAKQQEEMIQQCATSNENINATSMNRGGACFYYGSFPNSLATMMMSSGQCSPSDTLDSGTCSDLDGTPPPLPKKKNSSTVLLGVGASNGSPIIGGGKGLGITGSKQPRHNRAGSVTSSGPELDSDDNESNISCDSLNSSDLASRIIEHRSIRVNGTAVVSVDDKIAKSASHEKKINEMVNDEKLRDDDDEGDRRVISDGKECRITDDDNSRGMAVRNNNNNNNNKNHNNNNKNNSSNNKDEDETSTDDIKTTVDHEMNEKNNGILGESSVVVLPTEVISASGSSSTNEISPSVSPSPSGASSLSKASSTPRARSPVSNGYASPVLSSPMVKECTYEERKIEQNRINEENAAANYYANYNRKNGTKYLYDDDRFYEFHINENSGDNENDENAKIGEKDSNEYFAGYKILDREAIRSAKGTVRGVKNRVRAGIATFLQKPSIKNYKTKDAGKIVVYVTTMSIVRETYFACIKMLQILKTHMVKHEVRDLFMSRELQTELKERIGYETIEVPQLFIDGQYIGNVDTVERLNESGELRRMFKPYKSPSVCTTCIVCGGCRLLPCRTCNGSKKSPVRYDFMNEFCWLRCMNCDEVGLVRCTNC